MLLDQGKLLWGSGWHWHAWRPETMRKRLSGTNTFQGSSSSPTLEMYLSLIVSPETVHLNFMFGFISQSSFATCNIIALYFWFLSQSFQHPWNLQNWKWKESLLTFIMRPFDKTWVYANVVTWDGAHEYLRRDQSPERPNDWRLVGSQPTHLQERGSGGWGMARDQAL